MKKLSCDLVGNDNAYKCVGRLKSHIIVICALAAISFAVAGCDYKDAESSVASLVSFVQENPGVHCQAGGIKVNSGLDQNRNGVLEEAEIQSSEYLCNGKDGQDGSSVTKFSISMSTLAVGSIECPFGGVKLDVYQDTTLVSSQNICNAEGTDTNTSIDSESFDGAQNGCTNGGIMLTIHIDGQADQVKYFCNGPLPSVCELLECGSNRYCDNSSGCRDKKSDYEPCTSDEMCLSGSCQFGLCSSSTNTCEYYGDFCVVNQHVQFGTYYKTDNVNKEPIQWRVLEIDRNNRKMLLFSKYVLDVQPYHPNLQNHTTWKDCTLRAWLNNDFMTAAFTETEQAKIEMTHLENPDNKFYHTSGGDETDDKLFLLGMIPDLYGNDSTAPNHLSVSEHFNDHIDRRALITKYALFYSNSNVSSYSQNLIDDGYFCTETNYQEDQCIAGWWLRTPGQYDKDQAFIDYNGFLNSGYYDNDYIGVRPALWVKY